MKDYEEYVAVVSYKDISRERSELFEALDGDVFFSMNLWPVWTRRLFWKKPLGDEDSFKLLCFFIGNGCPPLFVAKWILSSQFWNLRTIVKDKLKKRTCQANNFFLHLGTREHEWFYFDIHFKLYLYMNGNKRLCPK